MKLRKSGIEVRKNFPVLRWKTANLYGGVVWFLRGELGVLSRSDPDGVDIVADNERGAIRLGG